ncbi:MAG: hypothetical protein IPL92_04455 [Saprospiraceae bacterium]|nr:hypothetical protein [Candidatus Opimibacter iunctus]
MKNIMPFLLALILISCQKEEFSPLRTSEFSIHASSNGADYPIKVAVPVGYDPDHQQYATIYVLDGDENFDFVAAQCESISHGRTTDNVLVVSIGYGNDRAVDYTPSTAEQGGGKAAAFMQFIHDDLIPRIESLSLLPIPPGKAGSSSAIHSADYLQPMRLPASTRCLATISC